ncbi:FERM domain-containing protein 8 [Erpetoichthys calabaricus]|uniref:FERM domain-containing protein 8 n=1 Tax=Erpetoichthys calabaricus TaxID=27687 RepID=A0A8C4S9V4_ERPCA|nr:FERM domain-containing protein 8 [Erpetoichthys calabaricus]
MEGCDSGLPSEPSEPSQRGSLSSAGARALEVLIYLVNDTAIQLMVDNMTSITAQDLGRSVREALQLPEIAGDVFTLWIVSPLLELQLKPKHQPYKLCRQWQDLLYRFTDCSDDDIAHDEPCLQLRRNVFFPKAKEFLIEDESVLRLLYEEAKMNILDGRYPCDIEDCERLGALSCRIELGQFSQQQSCTGLLREKLDSYLPSHLCRRGHGNFFSAILGKGARQHNLEQSLLQAYQTITDPSDYTEDQRLKKHLQDYLHLCHQLPYYGCAFFTGEIDKPVQGFLQRGGRKSVFIAISLEGVYVIDIKEKHVLLGLHFNELSWDHTYPEEEDDTHILWLEFDGEEAGTSVNKLLKIYSKQAELMSGLIEYCLELSSLEVAGLETGDASTSNNSSQRVVEKRGKLKRQNSVVCSRIQNLATINYVDDGREIKRVKPKRAASFFTRQAPPSSSAYTAVQVSESLEQG